VGVFLLFLSTVVSRALLASPGALSAQGLGSLVSPGPLTRAHSKLEGLDNCQKCHEPGKKVTAQKCLECHKPIAQEMAEKKGVHRRVGAECAKCHTDHAGVGADIRHLDVKTFDHKAETGFALAGKHAGLDCGKCHKTRSFLTAKPECAACHADPHKGVLGTSCATCHPVSVTFKETRKVFDHSRTAYPLTGAHVATPCEKCHVANVWKGIKFASCSTCHKDPHAKPLGTCAGCHTTTSFKYVSATATNGGNGGKVIGGAASGAAAAGAAAAGAAAGTAAAAAPAAKFDHAKTGYPLVGRHAVVACGACHVRPATKVHLKYGRCDDCHKDPHKGVFKSEDCAACHKETGFKGGTFDHAKTRFPLVGKHVPVPCASCHKGAAVPPRTPPARIVVDFRSTKSECASCHVDVHKAKLGTACETCHSAVAWRLETFRHPGHPEFFAGGHAKVACDKCHGIDAAAGTVTLAKGRVVPVRIYRNVSLECAACHKDPHLGQVSKDCATCHSVEGAKFAPDRFDHATTKYPLTGKHNGLECGKCHVKETAVFPAGRGTAVRLTGLSTDCRGCHKDIHLGQLGTTCQTCHSTATFAVKTYKHRNKELAGFFVSKHATVDCASCHKKVEADYPSGPGTAVRFVDLPTSDCRRCHDDPHRGALGNDCTSCHTISKWQTASRAFHKSVSFPLEGQHLATPCAKCHWDNVYKGTPTTCYDCHWIRRQDDLYRTLLGSDCQNCHRPISWTAVMWDHTAQTGYSLNAAHANLRCDKCHTSRVFAGTPTDCYSCHRSDYLNTRNPNHVTSGFPTTCETCHRPGDTTWQQGTFTSHSAFFPLQGAHLTAACASCHANNNYKTVPTGPCSACHMADYQKATAPINHVAAGFPTTCDTCHKYSDASWTQATFDHSKVFPLAGAHATTACANCHKGGNYSSVPTSPCSACHQADFQTSKNPPHVASGFSTACETCHKFSDATWQQGTFAQHSTVFPLAGAHLTAPCASCHLNNNFTTVPKSPCSACHQADFQKATAPVNHSGFPTACETCHAFSDTTWQQKTPFNHATYFTLSGAHSTAACASCHTNNNYATTPTSPCSACHQADFQSSKNPPHVAAGFPTTCDTCHKFSDATWQQGTFAQHSTVFPLAGAHLTAPCASCHPNNNFTTVPKSPCSACHQADFQKATAPVNHSGFPTACETCHAFSDTTWQQKTPFNHAAYFALAGAHTTAPCQSCHTNNNYASTPKNPCSACHQADFQNSKNPPHVSAGFPTTCDACHKFSDATWQQGTFLDHSSVFPLSGAHLTTACANCHKNNNFTTVPKSPCTACHQADLQNATTPVNHAGFPTACETCHSFSDTTWQQKTPFNHSAYFALAGAHVTAPCASCHKNNNYATVPTNPCSACHMADYQTATTPVNHAASNFPTTCDTCHKFSDATWTLATFSHTSFPLAGAHATTACTNCHKNNNYTTVPTSPCTACHQTDFQNATTPVSHAGFPTACESCHRFSDTTWAQKSAFNHSAYFALAGAHTTAPCASCHKNNNYTTVPSNPCSACHMADYQTATTPVNHVASNFPTTCDSCHKFSDATWTLATFDHSKAFPLSGAHATTACVNCHKNNNYTTVPTSPCTACHQADFQNATTPVSHAGFPTACESCHRFSDTTWAQKSAFNHSAYFALAGAHVTAPCASCHKNNNYTTVPKSPCTACHQTDFQNATTPVNHAGFSTSCDSCHRFSDMTWSQKSAFNHSAYFALAGAHTTASCASCHKNNNYTTVPTNPCSACHMADYQTATTPVNHIASNFPTTCDTCHKFSDATWSQGTFNHASVFPLAGAHATTACANCHKNNNYTTVPTSPCTACHQTDFQNATTPVNHAGFPSACETCHAFADTTWQQKTPFNHSAYFALAGAHTTAPCASCHKNNNYTTIPTSPCSACHMTDFQNATTPVNHAGFATTCDSCHRFSDTTWSQKSAFVHNAYFTLAGAHTTAPCASCHKNNNYTTVPTSPCSACHMTDYQAATSPVNHIAAGFPTTCDTCHKFSDTSWLQATFNHTWFPTNHGNAGGVCASCHTNPSDYLVFTCLTCHSKSQTDQQHQGRAGYVYQSQACYSCHPRGRGD
jgi:hypothetical protein